MHTIVAPSEKKQNRKCILKDSAWAKLKSGQNISKQNRLKMNIYNWIDKKVVFIVSWVPKHSVNLKENK